MKAITIHHPWAFWIAGNFKRIENRTWTTAYRGPLAIHASLTIDEMADPPDTGTGPQAALMLLALTSRFSFWDAREPQDETMPPQIAMGAVIAVANLTGVCAAGINRTPCECGPWAQQGAFHFQLSLVWPLLRPVPMRGYQRLWNVPADAQKTIRGALL